MIEVIIKNYLAEKLSVPVVLEVPANSSKSFVLLEKTGSSREERIDRAMLAIQSYAPSMYEAARLNERVKAAMDSAALETLRAIRDILEDDTLEDPECVQRIDAILSAFYLKLGAEVHRRGI